jgi:hypothetical protein
VWVKHDGRAKKSFPEGFFEQKTLYYKLVIIKNFTFSNKKPWWAKNYQQAFSKAALFYTFQYI